MRVGPEFDPRDVMPEEVARVIRLEIWTVFFLASIVGVMAWSMGSSQAMRTAFVEDLLSLVPPITLLAAIRYRRRGSSETYPYGRRRAPDLAFLAASLALLTLGALLLIDATMTLVKREHPTLGSMEIFGHDVWSGWVMIGALIYSAVPPVVLGRLKKKPASELHERALCADADMNAADWQTAVAGVAGILGVGLGFWWADAAAGAFISGSVLWDGFKNTRRVLQSMMHHAPSPVGEEHPDPLIGKVRRAVEALPWVRAAQIRLREEGELLCGEVYVIPTSDERLTAVSCEEAARVAREQHWRLHDVVVVPLAELHAHHEEG